MRYPPSLDLLFVVAGAILSLWLFVTKVLFGKGGKDDDI